MPYANKIYLMGNLGKDPEIRYLSNGTPVAKVSLAYTEKWKDKTTGEQQEATDWFTVLLYGRLAETVEKFLKKRDCMAVWGKLETRSYTDRLGIERTVCEVKANELQIIQTKARRPSENETVPDDAGVAVSGGIHDYMGG